MNCSYIDSQINRINRNILITVVIIVIVFSAITWLIYNDNGFSLIFFIFLTITIIPVITGIYKYKRIKSNLYNHSIIKYLIRYGNPLTIKSQIDQEAKNNQISISKLTFTPNWIFYPKLYKLRIINKTELIWVYKKITRTKHSVNFVPVGTTYSYAVVFYYFNENKKTGFVNLYSNEIIANEDESNKLISYIVQYAPWILTGYTEDIEYSILKRTSETLEKVISRRNSFYQLQ
jgi:hypothetical protein